MLQQTLPDRVEVVMLPPPSAPSSWVNVAGDFAWPLAAVIIAVALRKQILEILRTLTSRATKLSLWVVDIELASSTARAWTGGGLDEIRELAVTAPVGDSSGALAASLAVQTAADYTEIHLGQGGEWLTSRLFIVVTLVAQTRRIRALVFTTGDRPGRFVGTASVADVRAALSRDYPWLEVAYGQALFELIPSGVTARPELITLFRSNQQHNQQPSKFLEIYRRLLQKPALAPGDVDWVTVTTQKCERAAWVTPLLLESLLGDKLIREAARETLSTSSEELSQQVLRASGDIVPVISQAEQIKRIVNRRLFLDRSAKTLADQ